MPTSQINVIKQKGGLSFNMPKMSPKVLMVFTIVLAALAVITATLLYMRRQEPIAPNAPIPAPAAGELCGGIAKIACPAGAVCEYAGGSKLAPHPDASGTCVAASIKTVDLCVISFTINPTPTPSVSPSPTPTATPTPTPTPTPSPTPVSTPNSCNGTCGSNANCSSGMVCDLTSGRCRNPSCLSKADCICGVSSSPTPTPTPTPTIPGPTPTPPTLAEAGSVLGTWTISVIGGALLLIGTIAALAF